MTAAQTLILIPVHPAKSNWLVSFLNSLALYGIADDAKVLLVATDCSDHAFFTRAFAYHPLAKHLVFFDAAEWTAFTFTSDTVLDRLMANADGGIINLKKMIGLHWALQNGFEHVLCLDCDVLAVADFKRIHDVANSNHKKALYLGAGIKGVANGELFGRIITESASLFSPDDQKRIADLTDGHTVYTWYGDLPVYGREDLAALFDYMQAVHGSLEAFLSALRWASFDHMLYVLFRVACRGARIYDYRKELGIGVPPELLKPRELVDISTETGYQVGWIGAANAYNHPEAFRVLPNLAMLSHFDRF